MKHFGLFVGVAALSFAMPVAARAAADLYVVNLVGGTVGEYTATGALVKAPLVTGLDFPMVASRFVWKLPLAASPVWGA